MVRRLLPPPLSPWPQGAAVHSYNSTPCMSVDDLTDDLLVRVFLHLLQPRALATAESVSRRWFGAIEAQLLWRGACLRAWRLYIILIACNYTTFILLPYTFISITLLSHIQAPTTFTLESPFHDGALETPLIFVPYTTRHRLLDHFEYAIVAYIRVGPP